MERRTSLVFSNYSLRIGALRRSFRLYLPPALSKEDPRPIVFSFHGWGDGMRLMSVYTQFDRIARRERAILVYPQGTPRKGKDGWAIGRGVDSDLAFFDALLGYLTRRYPIDPDRIYAMGMSNGAYFVHLLGARRSTTLAAVAAHSGGLGILNEGIAAERKIPVLVIHGAADGVVPVAEAVAARDRYRLEGHEVRIVEIQDWGHLWATKRGINEVIWDFFRSHPRPSPSLRRTVQ